MDKAERNTVAVVSGLFSAMCLVIAVIAATGNSSTSSSGRSDTTGFSVGGSGSSLAADETAGTSTVSVTLNEYSVTPATTEVKAGDVAFAVKNAGTIVHEMLVIRTDTPFDQLPVVDSGDPPAPVASGADKVDEAASVGETGDPDLQPGGTRTFTIDGLQPGKYVLICNLAGHYALGMRAAFTVTGSSTNASVPPAQSTGSKIPVKLVEYSVTPAAATAKAGEVTFEVTNAGTIEHEMLVLKTDTPFDQLPIVDSGDPPAAVASGADKVDEADNIGETGDPNLKPGDTRIFTVKDLKPGKYVLICNLAGHYGLGMRAAFTITG